ncbi:helix-turn-helix transcriptional regulator [Paraburkholderia sacchari]|uniref:Helix-turn-helix transcriptional regulator n=1 Tax=Paraburkholderia sacchari TaxID=159450 RepID=A0A8T6ZK17_9BURK|nr:AraC family transcriptional regulator [Paraburkholderia sacchari]NLP65136.1 helix-turn-helix transcriptional regulator [Paraburkholderia sacchari]
MNAVLENAMAPAAGRVALKSSSALGWRGFGAQLLAISAGRHRIPGTAYHRVGVHFGAPVRANCVCDGRRLARMQAEGDADVIPAGLGGVWTDAADCTVLSIRLEDAFVRTIAEQLVRRPDTATIAPRLQLRDARVQHLAWALRAELDAGEASDPLYAESIGTALAVRLLDAAEPLQARRAVLAPHLAARVTDYIESHLDARLTLTELAALVDLSVPHFKVLFRGTLGMPVHQYVVRRRVERARKLLLKGGLNATQVALDVGFAHQSHLAHWMNRVLGVTPREVMREAVSGAVSGAVSEAVVRLTVCADPRALDPHDR